MIKSFACRDTETLFQRLPVRRFGPELRKTALRKLLQLDATTIIETLSVPPGNRLEALKGRRRGAEGDSIRSASMINGGSAFGGRIATPLTSRSSIITEGGRQVTKKLSPIHPGEILLKDFLKPLEISQYRLAQSLSVPPRRINEIVLGKRSITADTALRLGRFFGMESQFWLNLQARFDLECASDRLADRLKREVQPLAA